MSVSKNLTGAFLTTHSPIHPVFPPLVKSKSFYKIEKLSSLGATAMPTNSFKAPELKKLNNVQPYFIEMYNKNKRLKSNTDNATEPGQSFNLLDDDHSKSSPDRPLHQNLSQKGQQWSTITPDPFDVSCNQLVEELWRSRTTIMGIDVCLSAVCESNPSTLYTLLPKRRIPSLKQASPRLNPGVKQAELLATLPHTAELKTHSRLRANKRGPSFYRHFGQEDKIEQYYVDSITKRTGRAPTRHPVSQVTRSNTRVDTGKSSRQNVCSISFKNQDNGKHLIFSCQEHQSRLNRYSIHHPSRADSNITNKTALPYIDTESTENHSPPITDCPQIMSIDIAVQDESGQVQKLNIDESDAELRRGSVVERLAKDRQDSEMVAEEIRQTAETRRKELAELLDEHDQIVHEIDRMSSSQTAPSEETKSN